MYVLKDLVEVIITTISLEIILNPAHVSSAFGVTRLSHLPHLRAPPNMAVGRYVLLILNQDPNTLE